MRRMYRLRYGSLVQNYSNVIDYLAKNSDRFSLITEQVRPYGATPPRCRHDELLRPIAVDLTEQAVGVRSWPGTVTSAKHKVLNMYRITKTTRQWLAGGPNLLLYRDDLPEDICFYRSGEPWAAATTHEKEMTIIEPTEEDLLFFAGYL